MNRNQRRTTQAQRRKDKKSVPTTPVGKDIAQDANGVGDDAWGDLERVYSSCVRMASTPFKLKEIFKDKEKLQFLDKETAQLITQRLNDITGALQTRINELKRIRALHNKRTEDSIDERDLVESINIGQQYFDWQERFDETVTSPTSEIFALFHERLNEVKEQKENPILSKNYKG